MTSRPAPRHRWLARLPALVTVALAGVGWWVLVNDPDGHRTGQELGWVFGAFAGFALVSSLRRSVTGRAGFAGTVHALWAERSSRSWSRQAAVLAWPRWRAWLLPWVLIPLFALGLPVAFRASPGDASIVGVLFFVALVVGYAGLLAGVLVWSLVLLPLGVLARAAWFVVRRRPLDDDLRFAAAVCTLLLGIVVLSIGLVAPRPPVAGDGGSYARRPGQLAAFFGAGDQTSPWLWVARAALLVVIGAGFAVGRTARRPPDGAAPASAPLS